MSRHLIEIEIEATALDATEFYSHIGANARALAGTVRLIAVDMTPVVDQEGRP